MSSSTNTRMPRSTASVVYVCTALMLVFTLAPMLVVLAVSFSGSPFIAFPPHDLTVSWYTAVLSDPEFQDSMRISLTLALFVTLAALVLGIPATLYLAGAGRRTRGWLELYLTSPLTFPALITGLGLLKFFSSVGMQGAFLNLFLAHTLITLPYVIRSVGASFRQVEPSLADAARTLGANPWRVFWRVTFPQIVPGVVAAAVFAFMTSLDNFPVSMWLSDARVVPLPILLFQRMSTVFDPSLAAMSGVMIGMGVVAVLIIERVVGLKKAMGF